MKLTPEQRAEAANLRGDLMRILLAKGVPFDEAEDAVQEALIDALTSSTFQEGYKLLPWLTSIAMRNRIDLYRKNTSRSGGVRTLRVFPLPDDFDAPLEDQSDALVLLGELDKALAKLKHRDLMELRLQGFSNPEIAKIKKIPLGTAKTRLHRDMKLVLHREGILNQELV